MSIKKYWLHILVFALFVVVRMPLLGQDIFNTDVWKWKTRTYNFGNALISGNFEQTVQKYHPGVSLMWLGSVGVKVANELYKDADPITFVFGLHFIQKLVIVLFLGFCTALIYGLLKDIIDSRYALLGIVLLTFEPFYLGLTRVIHLEGLMATLMVVSALYLYKYKTNVKNKDLILSAFFAGLAFLTKSTAIFMVPFAGLCLLLWYKKGFIKPGLFWILGFVATFFVIWPATWVNLGLVLNTMFRGVYDVGVEGGHDQFFFGKYVQDPGILFYPVALLFRSSGIFLISLIVAKVLLIKNKFTSKDLDFVKYLLLFGMLYLVEITIPSKKLDRYFLPSFMSLGLVAVFGLNYFFDLLHKYKLLWLGGALIILRTFILLPDYFSFYNPLLGGLRTGMYVIEPKWMIGIPQINKYFQNEFSAGDYGYSDNDESFEKVVDQKLYDSRLSVGFQEKYYTQIWPFFRRFGSWAVIKDLTPFAKLTTYFVYPVWDDESYKEDRFKLEFVDTIKIRGTEVYRVYKRV